MNQYRSLIEKFASGPKRPVLNIVMDGYGIGKQDYTDAIHLAKTPFMDYLRANFASTTVCAHGHHVGLPGEKDLGGSEVGHLTWGAGSIIDQGPTVIQQHIDRGDYAEQLNLVKAFEQAKGNNGSLHLMGLLSDANIHSNLNHFIATIEAAAKYGVEKCYVHGWLDGRDVGIQTADHFADILEKVFYDIKAQYPNYDYAFASAVGREVASMDRDLNWGKVELGWKTHVEGASGNNFPTINDGIKFFREQTPGLIDQDCPPFNIVGKDGKVPTINDGDAVLNMNFRGDRAIEITRAFTEEGFDGFEIAKRPDVFYAGMMIYDEDTQMPANVIVEGSKVEMPFGRRILEYGMNQFRLAETQKFAHVTFFFNGGYRNPLDPSKEDYHLIASDKINSFAAKPEMKAMEIAQQAVKFLKEGKHDFGLINFANTDMVGHCGEMAAAIKAAEVMDVALKMVCDAIKEANAIAIISADHGNADEMIIHNKKTDEDEPCTKHTINQVPLIIYDPLYQNDYQLKQMSEAKPLNLSMIAATNHILMGREIPSDLNDSLFDI